MDCASTLFITSHRRRKRIMNGPDGIPRRNPVRKQNDYVITRCRDHLLVTNARSYNGITTETDHYLVKTVMKIQWRRMKSQLKYERIDIINVSNPINQGIYKNTVQEKFEPSIGNCQEKWDKIIMTFLVSKGNHNQANSMIHKLKNSHRRITT